MSSQYEDVDAWRCCCDFFSTANNFCAAPKCNDGNTNTFCHTKGGEAFPWIALQFLQTVDFSKVEIVNRGRTCCGERMKNMRIVASEALPSTTSSAMSGGNEFASFTGPSATGRTEIFTGSATGKVLVIQMETDTIHLAEIRIFGKAAEVLNSDPELQASAISMSSQFFDAHECND